MELDNPLLHACLVACDQSYNPVPANGATLTPFEDSNPGGGDPPEIKMPDAWVGDLAGWTQFANYSNDSCGFGAVVYRKPAGQENGVDKFDYIVALRGTRGPNAQDWVNNLSYGWDSWAADKGGQKFFNDYLNTDTFKNSANTIDFTGQSLGGALAQYAAYQFRDFSEQFPPSKISLTTFNGLGGVQALTDNYAKAFPGHTFDKTLLSGAAIRNYWVTNDIVCELGGGHLGDTSSEYLLDFRNPKAPVDGSSGEFWALGTVDAHRIESGFYAGFRQSSTDFSFAVQHGAPRLNVPDAAAGASAMANLLNSKGEVGSGPKAWVELAMGGVWGVLTHPAQTARFLHELLTHDGMSGDNLDAETQARSLALLRNHGGTDRIGDSQIPGLHLLSVGSAQTLPTTDNAKLQAQVLESYLQFAATQAQKGAADVRDLLQNAIQQATAANTDGSFDFSLAVFNRAKDFFTAHAGKEILANVKMQAAILSAKIEGSHDNLSTDLVGFLQDNSATWLDRLNNTGDSVTQVSQAMIAGAAEWSKQQGIKPGTMIAELGEWFLSLISTNAYAGTDGGNATETSTLKQDIEQAVSDTFLALGNTFSDFTQKYAAPTVDWVSQMSDTAKRELIADFDAAMGWLSGSSGTKSGPSQDMRKVVDQATQAAQTIVVMAGSPANPFNSPSFDPAVAPTQSASVKAGQIETLTAYLPFAAGSSGQKIHFQLSGATAGMQVSSDGSNFVSLAGDGGFDVVVPDGARQATFSLLTDADSASGGAVSLSATLEGADGQATHQTHVEFSLTLEARSQPTATIVGGATGSFINDYGVTTDFVWTEVPNTTSHKLQGGSGNDFIAAMNSSDVIKGGTGNDWIVVNRSNSTTTDVTGGHGDNVISTSGGTSVLRGGAGNNLIDANRTRRLEIGVAMQGNGGPAPDYAHLTDAQIWNAVAPHFSVVYQWEPDAASFATVHEGGGSDCIFDWPPAGVRFDNNYLDAEPSFGETNFSGTFTADGGTAYTYSFDAKEWMLDVVTPDGNHTDYYLWENIVPVAHPEAVTLIGGQGNNALYANDAGNMLVGGGKTDVIVGGAGNDTILGGNGQDLILGGGGDDFIQGGSGSSTGEGPTRLIGNAGNNTIMGGAATSLLFAGDDSSDWATSQTGNNYIQSGSGESRLYGAGGNDTLIAGSGNATLYGGAGNEYLQGGSGKSALVAGDGKDTLVAGDGDATLQGGAGTNLIYGGSGVDLIFGGTGDSTIYAGDGGTADRPTQVWGDAGPTTIYGGAGVAQLVAGSGSTLIYGGDGIETLQGGSGDSTLTGGSGTDVICGGSGATTIVFGSGDETVYGGQGTTQYEVDAGFGNVTIGAVGAAASMSFHGGITVDDLSISAAITEDSSSALIMDVDGGGSIAMRLDGGAVNRFQFGGTVLDLEELMEAAGSRQVTARGRNGTLTVSAASGDTLVGGDGNDTLVGIGMGDTFLTGQGATTIDGGFGDNTFYINNSADVIRVPSVSAHSQIFASVDYVLPANIATLTLTGTADLVGTGNALRHTITANDGDDTLIAGTGVATLIGGAGSDTFVVNNSADVVMVQAGSGTSTIRSSVSYVLPTNADRLVLTGTADLVGEGNDADNEIIANDGNDYLQGGAGNDTLVAGSGRDTLDGGSGIDTYVLGGDFGETTVVSAGGDRIEFDAGVSLSDLTTTVALDATNVPALLIHDVANGHMITVSGAFDGGLSDIEFANGTDLSLGQFLKQSGFEGGTFARSGGNLTFSGTDHDSIVASEGNDTIEAWGNNDTLVAGSGNDNITSFGDQSVLIGGAGCSVLRGYGDGDTLIGGAGENLLVDGADNATYVLTQGGSATIQDGATSGVETIMLPQGMSFADYFAVRDGTSLIMQSLTGDTTAVVQNFFASRPQGVQWLVASEQDAPQSLDDWVSQHEVNPKDYESSIESVARTFRAKQRLDLESIGRKGITLGNGGTFGANWSGYSFKGITQQDVSVEGADLEVESSEVDHTWWVSEQQEIQVTKPVYVTTTVPGQIYTVTMPKGYSSFVIPHGATADPLSATQFRIFMPDTTYSTLQGYTTTTEVVTMDTFFADRAFTLWNVTADDRDSTIYSAGPFVGTVTVGNGNNNVNLDTMSGSGWDVFYDANRWWPSGRENPIGLGAFIRAGNGNNVLTGTDGDDVIAVGTGYNVLDGGRGSDTYYVPMSEDSADVIFDSGDPTAGGVEQTAVYGGLLPMDTLVLPNGISPSDLKWRVFQDAAYPGRNVLQLNYGTANVLLVYSDPYPTGPMASINAASVGVELFQFADGTVLTREQLMAQATQMASDFAPTADAHDLQVKLGQTVSAAQLVTASDTGDNAITRYEFKSNGDGGYFSLSGQAQAKDTSIDIGAHDLGNLVFVGSATQCSNGIQVRVFDGAEWSSWSSAIVASVDAFEIRGGDGDDLLIGTAEDERIYGGDGNDTLLGGAGNDTLAGEGGRNTITGGTGDDLLIGGSGQDNFVFNLGDGNDTIVGGAGSDVIDFGTGVTAADLAFTIEGNDLRIGYGSQQDAVLLKGSVPNGDGLFLTPKCILADGSTVTYWANTQGSFEEDVCDANGVLIADAWRAADGSYGNDSWSSDGSGSGVGQFPDGGYSTYAWDAQGNFSELDYELGGRKRGDAWAHPDGTWGSDTFNVDGSSSGDSHRTDGSYSTYVDDGEGDVTTNEYAADGTLISSSTVNSKVLTGGPNEIVTATGSGQTLVAALNDTLVGGADGNTTFAVGEGEGSVVVEASGTGNVLQFGAGIVPDQVTLGLGSLLLRLNSNGDVVHIEGFDPANAAGSGAIQNFTFADGSTLTYEQLLAKGFDIYGGSGNETLTGTNLDNRIHAGSGNQVLMGSGAHDTLYGGAGSDTLIGGNGTDVLIAGSGNTRLVAGVGSTTMVGGPGQDTFVFNLGDGQDEIIETTGGTGGDVIEFGVGVAAQSVRVTLNGADIVVSYGTQGDSVRIKDGTNGPWAISRFVYADGGYGRYTRDAQGNGTLTNYSAAGVKQSDSWTRVNGTSGTDIFNADGSVTTEIARDSNLDGVIEQRETVVKSLDGSKTDDVRNFNPDGTLKNDTRAATSADGLTVNYTRDTNGDGLVEQRETVVKSLDGSKTDDVRNFNPDGTLKADTLAATSADGLTVNYTRDTNGDGIVEQRETVIKSLDGSKTDDIRNFNPDGTLKNDTLAATSADGLTVNYTRDTNGDGLIEQRETVVKSLDGSKTDDVRNFNPDGTLKADTLAATSADGLTVNYTRDTNGDGLVEQCETVIKSLDGSKTDDVRNFNPDGTLKADTLAATSADGLTVNYTRDTNGDGLIEQRETVVKSTDGSKTDDVRNFNPDGTLKADTLAATSADGLTVNYTRDTNGDGLVEQCETVIKSLDGSKTDDVRNFNPDGTLKADTLAATSADGLTVNYTRDTNGDALIEQRETVVKSADGSKTDDIRNFNPDGTLKADTLAATSADGLTISYTRDSNGDGLIEQRETVVKSLDGSKTDDVQNFNADGTLKNETVICATTATAVANEILLGGSAVNSMTGGAGNDFLAGGKGNDALQGAAGYNVFAFDRGDGQDSITPTTGSVNVLSLGGGIGTGDLSFQKSGNNLLFSTGGTDVVTLKNWYAATTNQDVATLQMISDGSGGQPKVQTFDFQKLVAEFDQARATGSTTASSWSLMNGLLDAHLADSDTAALGGDLAYEYGVRGSLSGMSLAAAETTVTNSNFAIAPQALHSWGEVSGGPAQLK
jgi:Ca2+-binding RTX toxin-like protein